MVKKLGFHYTFKVVSKPNEMLTVECYKWEEFADIPSATYKLQPTNKTAFGGCSCPAYRVQCKHMRCVQEAMDGGFLDTIWQYQWTEKGGWEKNTAFQVDNWDV